MLTQSNLQRIEELKKLYPSSQALTLPVLWMVQEQEGYISEESMKEVAELLNVTVAHVLGVVTFYTMFHREPKGRHHVEVCTNVSCLLKGSDDIVKHLEKRLGVTSGETTQDKRFSLSETECMGACGYAPMFAVGEKYYERLTTQKVDEILEKLT